MRKAFNFYRSYFEVAKELSDEERLKFYDAIMNRQFYGIESELTGLARFAYISQKHSIDSQVIGYESKTGEKLTPCQGGTEGGTEGGCQGGSVQGKEQVKEQGEGKGEQAHDPAKKIYRQFDHLKLTHSEFKKLNEDYSKSDIDEILDRIENWRDNKKYKSLYRTAQNWLKIDRSKKQESELNDPYAHLKVHL